MNRFLVAMAGDRVAEAALRVALLTYADTSSPDYAADVEYAQNRLAIAARNLVQLVDRLPADQQPTGWKDAS